MNNILNINFEEGKIIAKVGGLWQWDKGQKMRVFGTGITQDAEIHFSLMEKGGSSVTLTGEYDSSLDALIADIPDRYLGQDSLIDYKLYAFIYVRSDAVSAETVYKIIMTVKARPKPDGYDAEAASGAEQFKVTITGTFNSETRVYDYSSDRTRDEVNEAADAGKYVYAYVTTRNTIMTMIASGWLIRMEY